MPINLEYRGAECPDCGEPIDDDKEAGDECENCGHVFSEANADAAKADETTDDDGRRFAEGGSGVGFNEE